MNFTLHLLLSSELKNCVCTKLSRRQVIQNSASSHEGREQAVFHHTKSNDKKFWELLHTKGEDRLSVTLNHT